MLQEINTLLPEINTFLPEIDTKRRDFNIPMNCTLNTDWGYVLCTSFNIVVIQNTLKLSLDPGIVCVELVEVNLMACCLRFYTLHQSLYLRGILASD